MNFSPEKWNKTGNKWERNVNRDTGFSILTSSSLVVYRCVFIFIDGFDLYSLVDLQMCDLGIL